MCQTLMCLFCCGRVSQQQRAQLCWAVPGEWTGKEANSLIWEKLRKHPRHPQRKSQELFKISIKSDLHDLLTVQ